MLTLIGTVTFHCHNRTQRTYFIFIVPFTAIRSVGIPSIVIAYRFIDVDIIDSAIISACRICISDRFIVHNKFLFVPIIQIFIIRQARCNDLCGLILCTAVKICVMETVVESKAGNPVIKIVIIKPFCRILFPSGRF